MIKSSYFLSGMLHIKRSGLRKALLFSPIIFPQKNRIILPILKTTLILAILFFDYSVKAQNDIPPTINEQTEKLLVHSKTKYPNQISATTDKITLNKNHDQNMIGGGQSISYMKSIVEIKFEADALCQPEYQFGCSDGDGITDFAFEQIQNFNNDCADNTGNAGWSEYYDLDPAVLIPGNGYEISMATGYSNQHVNIWIDFNDDLTLTPDEIILNDFIIELPDTLYEVPVTIPADAIPGQHVMRVMAVWPDAFDDPCSSYLYGEAEDYYVQIEGGEYGSLEGYVTDAAGGNPIEGAYINIGNFLSLTSNSGGYYYADHVLVGDWSVNCLKEGFNTDSAIVNIIQDITTSQNFQLTAPQMIANPTVISVTIEPNTLADEIVNLSNPGNGDLEWNGYIVLPNDNGADELFNLQFDWPVGFGTGEVGIECDGSFIYTSKWNGNEFYKYELDGTYIGPFTCGTAAEVRDMAFDGTYFYGAAANSTVYQMDFTNGTLVSQFTAPVDIRAIAYNEEENVFYGNNWDSDIVKFNMEGTNLGSFPVGPIGASYYGFAFDNYSNGAPYLWGYAQTGPTMNELIQIQLPSGIETGVAFDVGSVAAVGTGLAGGLAITNEIVFGYYTVLGTAQGINIWGLELCESDNFWLSIDPDFGAIGAGQNQNVNLNINSMDLLPGIYNAEIHFNPNPIIVTPIVEVTLHVEGLIPAYNLNTSCSCTDVILTWEMPPGGEADGWNVYRNGSLLCNSATMTYTDAMVYPDIEYGYFVKAIYSGEESQPSATQTITVTTPTALEPLNPVATSQGNNTVQVTWEMPETCLNPDEFRIYRLGSFVGSSTTLSFTDVAVPNGFCEYYMTAVYYFGVSGNSLPASVLVSTDELSSGEFQVFPNPTSDYIRILSPVDMTLLLLFDNSGKIVLQKEMNTKHFRIELKNLERGVYYLNLKTVEGEIVRKITVQ